MRGIYCNGFLIYDVLKINNQLFLLIFSKDKINPCVFR